MLLPPHPSLAGIGIALFVAWRVYVRVRRMIGRQRLGRFRPWFTVCFFPLLILVLMLGALVHPVVALALVSGVAVGTGMGWYGLRRTLFEATPTGLFYTPHAPLGIAISVLFVARIVYRLVQGSMFTSTLAAPPADFARSPLTLVIFGTLAGYYVTYAIGLLRWRAQVTRESERAGRAAAPDG